VSSFSSEIKQVSSALMSAVDKATNDVAKEIQRRAATSTLFKGTSSGLRDSIKIINSGFMSRTVLADKDYAWYVEFGNNHHGQYIQAHGKSLKFISNGTVVFAKRVKAHGPMPFMANAAQETEPLVEAIFAAEFSKAGF
jgi:HK97 gp10 family phage protein